MSRRAGWSATLRKPSARRLPGRSGIAIVVSSRTRVKPGGSPLGETSQLPSAAAVATRQNGDAASQRGPARAGVLRSLPAARALGSPSSSRSSSSSAISSQVVVSPSIMTRRTSRRDLVAGSGHFPRDRVPTPAQRQGPRPLRDAGRAAADGGERPHLGVRPRAAHADPGQGRASSPSCRCGGSTGSPTWCPTTCVSTDVPPEVAGRAVLCRRLEMFPVECVARGYLAGSGLADYPRPATVCGIAVAGRDWSTARELPEPIFTPATKAPIGEHDENVDLRRGGRHRRRRRCRRAAPRSPWRSTAGLATSPVSAASSLADTKFEFGRDADGAARAGRRGAHARLVAVLAGRAVAARPAAAVVRQAVRARLAHLAGVRLGPRGGEPPPPLPDEVVERDPGAATSRPTNGSPAAPSPDPGPGRATR